jgi:hypothetical protein
MNPSQPGIHPPHEQRDSYRCSVSGPRRNGRLRIGEREVAVEIVDESAKGFAVMFDGTLECYIGQQILVQVASAWTKVRVMNFRLQESIATEESEDPVSTTRTRLGLMRLNELDAWEIDPPQPAALPQATFKTIIHCLVYVVRPLTSVAGLIIMAPLAAIALMWALENYVPEDLLVREKAAHSGPKTENSRSRFFSPAGKETPPAAFQPAEPPAHARAKGAMPQQVIRSSRPESLLKPEVTKLLALKPEQLQQLRQIFDDYRTTSKEALLSDPGTRSPSNAHDPDIQLGRRGLAVFTEEQRSSLMWLLSRPEFLLKPESSKLLALSREQLQELNQIFDDYRTTATESVFGDLGSSRPPAAHDSEIPLGRRGLAVLTEEQRGSLLRLLSATDPPQESRTADESSVQQRPE